MERRNPNLPSRPVSPLQISRLAYQIARLTGAIGLRAIAVVLKHGGSQTAESRIAIAGFGIIVPHAVKVWRIRLYTTRA